MLRKKFLVTSVCVLCVLVVVITFALEPNNVGMWLVYEFGCATIAALPLMLGFFMIRGVKRSIDRAKAISPNAAVPKFAWLIFVITILGGCLGCPALAIIQENSWLPVSGVPEGAERVEPGMYNIPYCPLVELAPRIPDNATAVYQVCDWHVDGGSLQMYVVLNNGIVLGWSRSTTMLFDTQMLFKPFQLAIGAIIGFVLGAVGVSAIMNSISAKVAK